MDVIINDFSLDGQFKDVEDFFDSLLEETLPAFYSLVSHDCEILSSFETYSRHVSANLTLYNTLTEESYRGYPEATKLKSFLTSCAHEPYWTTAPQTDKQLRYSVSGMEAESVPNCFTEAFSREKILLSFQNKNFKCDELKITVGEDEQFLYNLFNQESTGKVLFRKELIGLSELLMSLDCGKKVCFFANSGQYYSDEGFRDGNLTIEDGISISKDFKSSIEYLRNGILKSRFSDSITYKGTTYYEFRCSLSNRREFRIYYYLDHDKLVYLNSIVKKTDTIPNRIKSQTVALISKYLNEGKSQ